MIWYITLWTNNLDEAVKFYDALLWELWATRYMETDRFVAWSKAPWTPSISVTKPYDWKPATVWNGNMIAIMASSTEEVDRLYKKAIELGWTDEGPSGPRWDSWFYSWYFRDLDWNKLSFFTMVQKS